MAQPIGKVFLRLLFLLVIPLIFSALANDMPEDTDGEATAAVDRALVAIAEAL